MKTLRVLSLLIAALPAGLARADDAAVTGPFSVPTEAIANEIPLKAVPPEKSPQAMQTSSALPLSSEVPKSLKEAVKADGKVLYAEIGGAKKAALAFVRGAGDAMTLLADSNGDGKFEGAGETFEMQPTEWKDAREHRLGTTWKRNGVKIGAAELSLDLREGLETWGGQVLAPRKSGEKLPMPLVLEWSDAKPAGVAKAPPLDGTIRWATGTFNDMKLVVAMGQAAGGAVSIVVAPESEKADLSSASVLKPMTNGSWEGLVHTSSVWATDVLDLDAGKKGIAQVVLHHAAMTARINPSATRRGTTTVDGKPWALCLLDGDCDGKFDSVDDFWWFGPVDPAQKGRRVSVNNMFEATEPQFALSGSGPAWRLASVAADGTATVAREPNPGPIEEYLARRSERVNHKRWFPDFDAAKEPFIADQRLDLSRPKAKTPPAWHFLLDFESAKALAAKEGKPLLVDFEADWCIWCKRLDYWVYPDAEVGAALSKFTLVKINNEFDPKNTFADLKNDKNVKWGGIPSVAVFAPSGKAVHFSMKRKETMDATEVDHIAGFLPPPFFAAALHAAYGAWKIAKDAPAPTPPAEPAKPAGGDAPKPPDPAPMDDGK